MAISISGLAVICCLIAELAQFTDDAWEQEDEFTFVTLLMKTLAITKDC
jgi:hypothetical protein